MGPAHLDENKCCYQRSKKTWEVFKLESRKVEFYREEGLISELIKLVRYWIKLISLIKRLRDKTALRVLPHYRMTRVESHLQGLARCMSPEVLVSY